MAGRNIKSPRRSPFSIIRFLQAGSGGVPPVRLSYRRVYLRPPLGSDWEQWATLRTQSRDFLVPREATWAKDALSRGAFRRRLRTHSRDWRADRVHGFLIFLAKDDTLLGGITLSNNRRGNIQSATLGYWVGAPHAGKGYMTEALHAVIRFAFRHLNLHRLEAACLTDNPASQRVLEKTGFTREGYARKYLCINGEWRDHLTFGLLEEDYPAKTEGMDREA